MPHTIIEHSFPIAKPQIDELLLSLNKNISQAEGNFDLTQCKARSVFCTNFVVADGKENHDFMHITVRIMAGRAVEIRKKLAEILLKIAGDFIKNNHLTKNQINLSVDIAEMEKEIYQKTVVNN